MSIEITPTSVRLNEKHKSQDLEPFVRDDDGELQYVGSLVDVSMTDPSPAKAKLVRSTQKNGPWKVSTTTPSANTRFEVRFELREEFERALDDDTHPDHELALDVRSWLKGEGQRAVTVPVLVGESHVIEEIIEPVQVTLLPAASGSEPNGNLWTVLHDRTDAIGFERYQKFVDRVFDEELSGRNATLSFRGRNAYEVLKVATEMFLLQEVPTVPGWPAGGHALLDLSGLREEYYEQIARTRTLPYIHDIVERLRELPSKSGLAINGRTYGILPDRISQPVGCELIWSYWHEEGMLPKTLDLIAARFQNRSVGAATAALSRLDLDPLRPLSNLFWGWVADDYQRLTVRRRAAEYEFEYGLPLFGRSTGQRVRPAERRSQFLEAFHHLLHACHAYYKEADDTTVVADAFPVLNALREVHLLLAQGATNQFGDLPVTSRAEFMVMQWILARPEMRTFLGGRTMVPYAEPWMDRVDTMKGLVGWPEATVTHFRDLAHFGEPIVLSIRWDNWNSITDRSYAGAWATSFRDSIQRYVHAYRAVTGVDLTRAVDATPPGVLLRRAARTRAM